MVIENILMQVDTSATNIVGLIVASATTVGTVASLILAVLNRAGLLTHRETLRKDLEYTQQIADKVIESKQDITTLADVTYKMMPVEAAKIVDAQNVKISELTKKLIETQIQLERAKPIITGQSTSTASIKTQNKIGDSIKVVE